MATLAACLPIETAAAGASAGPAAGYAVGSGLCAACRPADIARTIPALARRRAALRVTASAIAPTAVTAAAACACYRASSVARTRPANIT